VRLVAGEDFRYTMTHPGFDGWLPQLLAACDGRRCVDELVAGLDEPLRELARQVLDRLYGERVLVDGDALAAHAGDRYEARAEGSGPLLARVEAALDGVREMRAPEGAAARPLLVFCQDRLDYDEALRRNTQCRAEGVALLWVTTGPMNRGFVSPAFLPDAGPCLGCLYRHFHRLSPCPEIYEGLLTHARRGGTIEPTPFPDEGVGVLTGLVAWKIALLGAPAPRAAPYRLHVVETDSLEVTAYPVFLDPDCPACQGSDGWRSTVPPTA
jgi:bacteriocin biosynthesis cyclodehydratase domain-containing protein